MKMRLVAKTIVTESYEVTAMANDSTLIFKFDSEKKAQIFEDLLRYNTRILHDLPLEWASEICENLANYAENNG